MSIVELIAKYNSNVQDLLSIPMGQIKYLSPKIKNELISVQVENALMNEINAISIHSMIEKYENGIPKALVIKEDHYILVEGKDIMALTQ